MPIWVVIPARNEVRAIGKVLEAIPASLQVQVIVADNGSTDGTAQLALSLGATVVREDIPGYGRACLAALAAIPSSEDPEREIIVFLDADYSDHPEEMPELIAPIVADTGDLVIGSRVLGKRERGALLPQARFGNWLACGMIRGLFGHRYTDLGPFRAIRRSSLERLRMSDKTFGWTVEMQVKALQEGLRVTETPVSYRRRVGQSKITGTVKGSCLAGWKIIATIVKLKLGVGSRISR